MPTPDCNRILAHGSHFPFALINLHVLPKIGWIIGWTDDGSHIAPTFVNMLISENELAKLDRKTAASALSIRSASIAKCKVTNWTTITFYIYIYIYTYFFLRFISVHLDGWFEWIRIGTWFLWSGGNQFELEARAVWNIKWMNNLNVFKCVRYERWPRPWRLRRRSFLH